MSIAANPVDFEAVKARQNAVWSAGNYALIGSTLQLVGEHLCEGMDLRAGSRVLDVAAGNGNASLAAARRWCDVVSTDYVPALLEHGRRRAEANGMRIEFREADAENLPFADGEFDYVASTFGVMFAPNHEKAAGELSRVCRSGGKIGMANWTPAGFVGKMFKVVGRFAPPLPPGLQPPAAWGTEDYLHELFGEDAAEIHIRRRHHVFRFKSPDHFLDVFGRYFGPILETNQAIDAVRRAEFAIALRDLLESENQVDDGSLCIPGEYLEIVVTRR